MIDVLFCGVGNWNALSSDPEDPILIYHRLTQTYQVNKGAFSLRKKDELAYNETERFDGIQYLRPSTPTRLDDEFSKALKDKVLVQDKAYGT